LNAYRSPDFHEFLITPWSAPGQKLDSAGEIFAFQHDPEALGGNVYTVFNDESDGQSTLYSSSRAVTISLDLATGTTTLINPQAGCGNGQRLPRLDACVVKAGANALAEAAGIDAESVQFAGDLRIGVGGQLTGADDGEARQVITVPGTQRYVVSRAQVAGQDRAAAGGAGAVAAGPRAYPGLTFRTCCWWRPLALTVRRFGDISRTRHYAEARCSMERSGWRGG
jgi:hypothetical protein